MASFVQLLRGNRNYRYTWIGQVVSEIGDHFNNIARLQPGAGQYSLPGWWSAA